jgi:four helix bundle protein
MDRGELEARCLAFGVAVFAFCRGWHGTPGGRGPGGQLVDCATSIGANYRATSRARSRAEFVSKLAIVVEEADEAVFWLEFVQRVGLGDAAAAERLLGDAKELRAIFAASYRTARRNAPRAGRRL